MITDISPEAHDYTLKEAKKYAWGNIYLPPSIEWNNHDAGNKGRCGMERRMC